MRLFRTSSAGFLVFGLICSATTPMTAAETLKEALAAKNLPLAEAKLANLDKNITSGAELDEADQFVIAYYVDDGTGALNPPLFIDRYDRKSKEWKSAALPDASRKSAEIDDLCYGSILDIRAAGGRFFLDTHINPSAGCLLVVSPDMKLEASLFGWMLARLGNNLLIYERSQVHFAPVHPAEVAVYDLRTKRDTTIFPPGELTPARQARVAQLREFYKPNEEWCNKNDDPCDPQSFDSGLQGPVVTSEADFAAAFLISYQQIQFAQGHVQKPSGPKDILYVYRRLDDEAKMQVREMPLQEAKSRFGDVPLQQLLLPETLQKIFESPPAGRP